MAFIVQVYIETAEEALAALRIRGVEIEAKRQLIEMIAASYNVKLAEKVLDLKLLDGLPDSEFIRNKFSNVLSADTPPRYLVKALEFNPQGETRKSLLDSICQKGYSTAAKVFLSSAKLSYAEKTRLAQVVLNPNIWVEHRVLDLLVGTRGDESMADIRKEALGRTNLWAILRNPKKYLSSDSDARQLLDKVFSCEHRGTDWSSEVLNDEWLASFLSESERLLLEKEEEAA